ncbi:hypothetical protein JCM10213_000338 [Rhodosporidiobolus nylandii]
MHDALRKTSLEHLEFGYEAAESIKATDLTPLVGGTTKLPHLQKLDLYIAGGEPGLLANEVHYASKPANEIYYASNSWHFYDSWVLPSWPAKFPREDFEQLLEVAEVAIGGFTEDAMQIEDEYEREVAAFEAQKEEYDRASNKRYLSTEERLTLELGEEGEDDEDGDAEDEEDEEDE